MNAIERTGITIKIIWWAVGKDQSIQLGVDGRPVFGTTVKTDFGADG